VVATGVNSVYVAYKQGYSTGGFTLFRAITKTADWHDSPVAGTPGPEAEFITSAIAADSKVYFAHVNNECNNNINIYQLSNGVFQNNFPPAITSPTIRYLAIACDETVPNRLYMTYADISGYIRAFRIDL